MRSGLFFLNTIDKTQCSGTTKHSLICRIFLLIQKISEFKDNLDEIVKSPNSVTPVKTGVQNLLTTGFRLSTE